MRFSAQARGYGGGTVTIVVDTGPHGNALVSLDTKGPEGGLALDFRLAPRELWRMFDALSGARDGVVEPRALAFAREAVFHALTDARGPVHDSWLVEKLEQMVISAYVLGYLDAGAK